jgi:hypothetical protein
VRVALATDLEAFVPVHDLCAVLEIPDVAAVLETAAGGKHVHRLITPWQERLDGGRIGTAVQG